MSVAFLITAYNTVPSSLLYREMRFRALALVETGCAVLLAASMIAFALFGLRYWTLVLGWLLSSALSTGGPLALRGHGFAGPLRASLALDITSSSHILPGV